MNLLLLMIKKFIRWHRLLTTLHSATNREKRSRKRGNRSSDKKRIVNKNSKTAKSNKVKKDSEKLA